MLLSQDKADPRVGLVANVVRVTHGPMHNRQTSTAAAKEQ